MTTRKALRRLAVPALLFAALAVPTAMWGATPQRPHAQTAADPVSVGKELFQTSCVSCHGIGGVGVQGRGPSLVGVGAASADFYLSTGRMPLNAPDIRARRKRPAFNEEEIKALVAYVASLGHGPPIPTFDIAGADVARGGELFRLNCASCHGFAGAGGALSEGNQAPPLNKSTATQIKEAMRIGPGTMPVFSTETLPEEDADALAAYVRYLADPNNRGGAPLEYGGPIPEGLVAWLAGLGVLIGVSVWIGRAR